MWQLDGSGNWQPAGDFRPCVKDGVAAIHDAVSGTILYPVGNILNAGPAKPNLGYSLGANVHPETKWGRIYYGADRGGMGNGTWKNTALDDYAFKGVGDIANLNANSGDWVNNNLKWSQLRFDGWFHVFADKAGSWVFTQGFDDHFAFSIDGVNIICNTTYNLTAVSAAHEIAEGWHRFTMIAGDTYGGYGAGRITLNGGTFNTKFLKKGAGTASMTFAGGTVAATVNDAGSTPFLSGFNSITYGTGGLTVDTNGKDVNMANNTVVGVTVDSAFVKKGTGTLTVDALPPTPSVVVSNGMLVVSANYDNTSPLARRWSFNGADETANLTDSVGGTVASKIGTAVAFTDGEAVMTGDGNNAGSLNLGKGLLGTGDVSIEFWATRTGTPHWARVFDYGSDTANYFLLAWNYGTTNNRIQFILRKDGSDKVLVDKSDTVFADNVKYHIVVTVKANADGTSTIRLVRTNVANSSDKRDYTSTSQADWTIRKLIGGNFYIGHSQWSSDKNANAKYDEVRIWNGILSDAAIALSYAKGPDATTADLAEVVAASDATRTIEVATEGTLDLGVHTLRQPIVAGAGTVMGSLVVTDRILARCGETLKASGTIDLTNAKVELVDRENFEPTDSFSFLEAAPNDSLAIVGCPAAVNLPRGWIVAVRGDSAAITRNGLTLYLR